MTGRNAGDVDTMCPASFPHYWLRRAALPNKSWGWRVPHPSAAFCSGREFCGVKRRPLAALAMATKTVSGVRFRVSSEIE